MSKLFTRCFGILLSYFCILYDHILVFAWCSKARHFCNTVFVRSFGQPGHWALSAFVFVFVFVFSLYLYFYFVLQSTTVPLFQFCEKLWAGGAVGALGNNGCPRRPPTPLCAQLCTYNYVPLFQFCEEFCICICVCVCVCVCMVVLCDRPPTTPLCAQLCTYNYIICHRLLFYMY